MNHRRPTFPQFLVSSLAVGALLLSACQQASPQAAPAAKSGTTSSTEAKTAAPAAKSAAPAAKSAALTRVTVGQTNALESQDPYNQSDTFLYPFWCQVLGCLVGWDPKTGDPLPQLAESWKVENPTTWVFNLRKDAKWHDGTPFTAADVVHTLKAVQEHPAAKQKYRLSTVEKYEAVDDHTVRIVTKEPNAELLDGAFTVGIAMTSKAQAEKGADLSKELAMGTGPYKLKEWVPNSRVVISKVDNWWGGNVDGPNEVVYRYIKEDAARVTALLNGEIQLASAIPSQDVERIKSNPNTDIAVGDSLTIMFLGMNPGFEPWGNKKLRQAVNYAIDRDAIIKNVLEGYAERLDGPIGPGQYAYTPDVTPKYEYNPEKAKQLVAEAGFPNGVDVELSTPVNFYPKDKEITEAMIPMLNAVGIRAKLLTPEWPTLWANIQKGNIPFFYVGRGQVRDPGQPLSQYFETGVSPRLKFSDPTLDELFAKERAAFDPAERKALLHQVMNRLMEESPAAFMWRHKLLWGVSNNLDWQPRADEAMLGQDMKVKN